MGLPWHLAIAFSCIGVASLIVSAVLLAWSRYRPRHRLRTWQRENISLEEVGELNERVMDHFRILLRQARAENIAVMRSLEEQMTEEEEIHWQEVGF